MHPLVERVWQIIRRHDLIPAGGRVVAALSGGSDSVALVHLLRELETAGLLVVAGVGHFNHQLRGEAAEADERFCRELAARLSLAIDVETGDVRELARVQHISLEDAGRRARYEFFDRAAARLHAERVAVGHTRDDQAETFLLRLIRGAGPGGLTGIHPRVGSIVRPLIDTSRDELRAYLRERGISYCEDASNLDVAVPRNRVRHELVPLLRDRFSPGIVDVLAREAAIARDDADLLDRAATAAASEVVTTTPDSAVINVARLLSRPRGIARRIARRALQQVSGGRFIGFEHVQALLDLAVGVTPTGTTVEKQIAQDFPGVRAERRGGNLVLTFRGSGRQTPLRRDQPNLFRYSLSIPGEVWVPEAGCAIAAEPAAGLAALDRQTELSARGPVAVIQADDLPSTLVVRSRRPGDAFRPLGLNGRKKLQDFFVDRKVLRSKRDSVPLVVDERDRIIWVAGHSLAEEFRVTDRTQAVVILRLKDWGGEV